MAYDRYVAIYKPLLYTLSMMPRVYVPLIITSYVGGLYTLFSMEVITILIILISCGVILLAILRMCSANRKRKVFFYGSHLARVYMYHGMILLMYIRPSSSYVLEYDMVVSIFYTIVIPVLNPTI
ncbi:Olfactory receptor 5T1 [Fukomys damarensis]|uniref:Olfactory receptor 5T1 n=1 Tax=Fukomys damarensis TaxID=885580 RepID=A0A091E329_FUKDA|nr:Olfactory receptor 5T1 [Fukomys damarensis]